MKDPDFKKFRLLFMALLVFNYMVRLIIYYSTDLFYFGDFKAHLDAINKIAGGEGVSLVSGNFLFAISYAGYFFKYVLGDIDYFFLLNSLLGTSASAIISIMVLQLTGKKLASLLTLLTLSLYTEFMVFSSVFYTVVIMVFILSVLMFLLFKYYSSFERKYQLLYLILISLVIFMSFLFKQELMFLPVFMFIAAIIFRRDREFVRKSVVLASFALISTAVFYGPGSTNNRENKLANDFIFFGHTDYGGDGGEGSFIYEGNKTRYNEAWQHYLLLNGISAPDKNDRNRFQVGEIKKFVLHHPVKWVKLQFTKFFRTFGVVPEGISFKILYSGLLKNKLWLTSFVIVVPVALIVLLFIMFFNIKSIRKLFYLRNPEHSAMPPALCPQPPAPNPLPKTSAFLKIYLILFIYYLVATIFFGHYQERYRMPVMVIFIIPLAGFFLASFNKNQFFTKISLVIKSIIVVLLLTVWIFQARRALSNGERLYNAIESAEKILIDKNQNE